LESQKLAEKVAHLALEKKAEDVIILKVAPLTSMTDFFVICTGSTNTQVKAISEHMIQELKQELNRPQNVEGLMSHEWILLDYVDVIVHIFQPHKREFYGLERLWGDAEAIEIKEEV